jgi:hypothetical protein
MAVALQHDRDTYSHSHQYVWPIGGMTSATSAQRSLFREPGAR